jgi:hypothetical protein
LPGGLPDLRSHLKSCVTQWAGFTGMQVSAADVASPCVRNPFGMARSDHAGTPAGLRIRAMRFPVRCHQALTLEAENRTIQTNHPG